MRKIDKRVATLVRSSSSVVGPRTVVATVTRNDFDSLNRRVRKQVERNEKERIDSMNLAGNYWIN